jgi:hypothetical protein
MKNYLHKVKAFFQQKYQVSVADTDLETINEIILIGNQSPLFQIEMGLCQQQKENCIQQLHLALDNYHHTGMDKEEIKTIVRNVLTNRAPTPEITETVRLLIATE